MSDAAVRTVQLVLSPAHAIDLDRFKDAHGLASSADAIGRLLDIAFEAISGSEQQAPLEQARALADRLRAEGHAAEADTLHGATVSQRIGHALLEAVRESCQTILTTIEALDPKTQLLAEELRLEIDKRISK